MNFRVLIPARHDATRLPGKPLVDIAGKPLIRHVCERALESDAAEVWVATDDERIAAACAALDVQVAMTSSAHTSGTDRIAEVAAREGWGDDAILVDLQGDEPLMPASAINTVAQALAADPDAGLSTLAVRLFEPERFRDPNVAKIVLNAAGRALYFSRAPIPWPRDADLAMPHEVLGHIGIYGFRVSALLRLASEAPCAMEQAESLEQLRALWLGLPIRVEVVDDIPRASVDTPEDVKRVAALLTER
ncbi:MAG: 3-deoxy-manno-octulosonate cytidylyltransferase [Gammaproteobacteria bacterium]